MAEILRDPEGIPHIRARDARDAFFAQGWVHAQDRLFQMDADRHRAWGRWAEIAGPPGLAQDRLWRRLRVGASVEAEYRALPPDAREMFDAYAAGVNAYLAQAGGLPPEYGVLGLRPEPWRPWDSMAVYKARHVLMGVWQAKLWRGRVAAALGPAALERLMAPLAPGERLILPPGATEAIRAASVGADLSYLRPAFPESDQDGSNNWVLAGGRTRSGKPLLAGDPHRAVEVPNVYYQNHLACDEFDAVGLSFAGVPGLPHFGHNARVAWCITHTGADTQDLFVERLRGDRYEFRGQWLPLAVCSETLRVRGGPDEPITVRCTHHGPLLCEGGEYGISFAYTATSGAPGGWRCLRPMLRAGSCRELDELMRDWVDPVNNLLSADVDGNIAYRTRGTVPVRHRLNGWVPVPGWTGEHEWRGVIPYEEMPHAMNPPEGYIVTANNRVVGDAYPHYLGLTFAADDRARRIAERLLAETGWTAAAMTDVHADVRSPAARELLDLLPRMEGPGREILAGWDGAVTADDVAPTVYNALRDELALLVAEPILGPLLRECLSPENMGARAMLTRIRRQALRQAYLDQPGGLLPEGRTWPELLSESLARAMARLAREYGPDPEAWTWRRVHRLAPQHPLGMAALTPRPRGMAGDGDTVQAASFAAGISFTVVGASVARYVFDLDDWERSGWVVPTQAEAWHDHRLLPMRYDWAGIAACARAAIMVG
jgi:penicillin amidase